jgi:hypothetical protein
MKKHYTIGSTMLALLVAGMVVMSPAPAADGSRGIGLNE